MSSHEKPTPGLLRRAYQLVRWATLVILIVVVALILRRSPPPQVREDPGATARVESKLRELQSETEAGQAVELRLDEAELNAYLGANLALKEEKSHASDPPPAATGPQDPSIQEVQSSVKDVKIAILDNRIQAYVLFDFHRKDLSLLLEGRLHVEDGYLRFEPLSGKLGSLLLPQSTLEGAVRRLLASPENKEKLRLPPEIRDIHIENGELVIVYR